MFNRYYKWLHGQWPAGPIERMPVIDEHFESSVSGVYIIGDLTGVPLLKFAADSASRVVNRITKHHVKSADSKILDVLIIGAGVSGISASIEAQKAGLTYQIVESNRPLSTIENFPAGKPIFTYPEQMTPSGGLLIEGLTRETLLENLERQASSLQVQPIRATAQSIERTPSGLATRLLNADGSDSDAIHSHAIIVAIGRSGQFRALDVPGETLPHVTNRLHDPAAFSGQNTLVVGGSDTALETAVALARQGSAVCLSYRGTTFTRPKPVNVNACKQLQTDSELPENGQIKVMFNSHVTSIETSSVQLINESRALTLNCDAVFTMLGREAPLDFFRRSDIAIQREWRARSWVGLLSFFALCVAVYHWKSYSWFPHQSMNPFNWIGAISNEPNTILYTLKRSASQPSFYYTLIYSITIGYFGWRRIQRRRTPYVKRQTYCLLMFQWLPLFILPELILPWMGQNHLFIEGAALKPLADLFFETYDNGVGVERAYWRAYGFVLAWPLMVYNWFSSQPMWGWLIVGSIQTFVIIPFIVIRWGKGAYCGWVCSCGALAETLGDTHREKMPHGTKWNRLNMLGQVILLAAFVMLGIRIWGWLEPTSWAALHFDELLQGHRVLSYKWLVDVSLAGFFGVGLYFHFSGRVWCRFACPLAALMHIYARITKFRIFADKDKCISCNVCSSVCHQGIDVMAFANQGLPMSDPQCVRCSACVSSCPTGVLSFGRLNHDNSIIYDRTPASLLALTGDLNNAKA
jgi:NosR/NirI family transcriptional regulator, nitrous oxide reductase regulator